MSKHFFNSDPTLEIREQTRRQFFGKCAMGLGGIALASMLSENKLFGGEGVKLVNPLDPKEYAELRAAVRGSTRGS